MDVLETYQGEELRNMVLKRVFEDHSLDISVVMSDLDNYGLRYYDLSTMAIKKNDLDVMDALLSYMDKPTLFFEHQVFEELGRYGSTTMVDKILKKVELSDRQKAIIVNMSGAFGRIDLLKYMFNNDFVNVEDLTHDCVCGLITFCDDMEFIRDFLTHSDLASKCYLNWGWKWYPKVWSFACGTGNVDVLEILLSFKKPFGCGEFEDGIMKATRFGHCNIVRTLLSKMAPTSDLTTAILGDACSYGYLDIAKEILLHKQFGKQSRINHFLQLAVAHNRNDIIQELLRIENIDYDDPFVQSVMNKVGIERVVKRANKKI